jgi:hypothetical protein
MDKRPHPPLVTSRGYALLCMAMAPLLHGGTSDSRLPHTMTEFRSSFVIDVGSSFPA